jgi:AcrR family transcriptional regulator
MSEHVLVSTQPTARTPQKQSPATERLLRAGTQLIAREGLDGVNTNTIARAAGVGVGTFYSSFADKHALHRAIVVRAFDQLQKALVEAATAARGAGVAEEVRATVSAVVDFAEQNPDLFSVAFAGPLPTTSRGQPVMGFSSRPMERRLQALQSSGQIDREIDPAIAARGYFGLQNSVLSWWLTCRDRPPRENVIATLVRLHPALAGAPGRVTAPTPS